MIVNLPVCYRAAVPADWGATLVERRMILTRTFEIEELAPGDCEISAENIDLGTEDRFTAFWHDGSNWIRETERTVHNGIGTIRPELFNPDDADQMAVLIKGHAWRSHLEGCQGMTGREAEIVCLRWLEADRPATSKMASRRTANSSFGFELDRIRQFLSDVRLIDGHVYRRVGTPYLRIHPEGRASVAFGANPDHNGGYRFDRPGDAVHHLAELGRKDGQLGCEVPSVRIPEAFSWQDDEVSFDKVTDFIVEFIDYHGKGTSRGRQSANLRFFNAVPEVAAGRQDRNWLAQEMDAFCAVHETAVITSPPMVIRTRELLGLVRPTIVRWNLRPLELGNEVSSPTF